MVAQRGHAPVPTGARRPVEEQLVAAQPGLNGEHRARLIARVRRFVWSRRDLIARHGDRADRFHVIAVGEWEVVQAEPGRPPRVLTRLGRNDYLSEIGLLQASAGARSGR
jgi:CRP-like cAMP-binding protein